MVVAVQSREGPCFCGLASGLGRWKIVIDRQLVLKVPNEWISY
jgi:hypothetical protein